MFNVLASPSSFHLTYFVWNVSILIIFLAKWELVGETDEEYTENDVGQQATRSRASAMHDDLTFCAMFNRL
jgi:hypothetical protein